MLNSEIHITFLVLFGRRTDLGNKNPSQSKLSLQKLSLNFPSFLRNLLFSEGKVLIYLIKKKMNIMQTLNASLSYFPHFSFPFLFSPRPHSPSFSPGLPLPLSPGLSHSLFSPCRRTPFSLSLTPPCVSFHPPTTN